jgi:UDP-N-acetylglucosamine diphosphorylase/glucosamine-1-phosphate N-acetyltransferase
MTELIRKQELAAIILAAGKGTRMNSDLVKVLHPLCGKPMIWYVTALAQSLRAVKTVVVVGHQAQKVMEALEGRGLIYAFQEYQLGSAHAVQQARQDLHGFDGDVLILCGDVPLLRPATLEALLERHRSRGAAITVMTALPDDPGSYGRVVKSEAGDVLRIVEARDAGPEERKIREINTGIYCADRAFLFDAVGRIGNTNAQGEYYFTDIFEIAVRDRRKTGAYVLDDPEEAMGINTVDDLRRAEQIMKTRWHDTV